MRFLLRSTGLIFIALAFVALSFDGSRMLANGEPAVSSLRRLWELINPASYEQSAAAMETAIPYLWTVVIYPLLLFPGWMVLGGLGIVLYLAGYRAPPPDIVAET